MELNTREADIILNWKPRKEKANDGKRKRDDSSSSAMSDDGKNEKTARNE